MQNDASRFSPTAIQIQAERVSHVLLVDGKWYPVRPRTFEVDAKLSFSEIFEAGPGFTFQTCGNEELGEPAGTINGPISSILAVKHRNPSVMIDSDDYDTD